MAENMAKPAIRFGEFTDVWEQWKLGEVAEFNPKSVLPDSFEYVDLESVVGTDLIGHRTEQSATAPSRAQRLAKRGDVFYQTVRPYQKNNYLFELSCNDYVFSTGYAQMRPSIDSRFLFSRIQEDCFVNVVLDRCTGTSYPAINANDLAEIEIRVPIDKAEQERIGSTFKNLDRLIALHQHEHDKTVNIKKALLEKMFPKAGEDKPEIRFTGFTEAWERKKFCWVFDPIPNNTLSRAKLNYDRGDIKNIHYGDVLIKYGAIADCQIDEIPFITDGDIADYKNQLLCNSDIVIADAAEDEMVGKCTEIVGINDNFVVSGLHTVACRPKLELQQYYLGYYMNSPAYHSQLLPFMQGIKVLSISRSNLAKTTITYPTSQAEQRRIGRMFITLDRLLALHQRELVKLQNMKRALLEKMFV